MKKHKLILKLLLPSILCTLIINITNIPLEYSVLFFGFILGLVNWYHHKYKPIYGIILSILASLASFLITYFSFAITGNLFSPMKGDSGQTLGLIISIYLVAPLLTFLFYKYVFDIPKGKFTNRVIITSIVLLVSSFYVLKFIGLVKEAEDTYAVWQIVVALSLQLIIYQNELKSMFTSKKETI